MGLRRTFTWLAIAPLGIGLTTGLTITTTLLTQQPIGLSSEPLSAGDALAPRATTANAAELRAPAASSTPALVPHGGRAVATAASATHPASSPPPPAATPNPPAPAQPAPPTKQPTPANQPAHPPPPAKSPTTTPTKSATPTDGHGGRDGKRSSDDGEGDHGGNGNSGSGVRDD